MFSNFLMSILVVCTIMYQSVHSFTHVLSEVEQICNSDSNKHSHQHLDKKDCPVCDFTFSPFTTVEFQTFTFLNPTFQKQEYFFSEQIADARLVSYVFSRGPPSLI